MEHVKYELMKGKKCLEVKCEKGEKVSLSRRRPIKKSPYLLSEKETDVSQYQYFSISKEINQIKDGNSSKGIGTYQVRGQMASTF